MENRLFRRQFLLTPKVCRELNQWQQKKLDTHTLYVHPDCELATAAIENDAAALVGYAINPWSTDKSNQDILNDLIECESVEAISKCLYSLAGRFVFILKRNGHFLIFHDACGLRSVFYTKREDQLYCASQPLLLGMVTPLEKSENYDKYYASDYVKIKKEHCMPCGISLYKGVYQLVPNHYLEAKGHKQIRYYPSKKLAKKSYFKARKEFVILLRQIVEGAAKRYKLAIPLTAGWDSRVLASICKNFTDEIYFYTLQYRDLTESSADLDIPIRLSKELRFEHHVIDCTAEPTQEFIDIYSKSVANAHVDDWGKIAYGIQKVYPDNRLALKGNTSEIGRCYYYKLGSHDPVYDVESLSRNVPGGVIQVDFFEPIIADWISKLKGDLKGYDILDLYYWELRSGSWQTQSQLEWDIAQEVLCPFANRELLDIMFSCSTKYRSNPKYWIMVYAIKTFWKEAFNLPINPRPTVTRSFLRKVKEYAHRQIFTRLKKLRRIKTP